MNPYPKQNGDMVIIKTNNGKFLVESFMNGIVTKHEVIKDEVTDTGHRVLYTRTKYSEPEIPEEVIEFHKQTKGATK